MDSILLQYMEMGMSFEAALIRARAHYAQIELAEKAMHDKEIQYLANLLHDSFCPWGRVNACFWHDDPSNEEDNIERKKWTAKAERLLAIGDVSTLAVIVKIIVGDDA